MKKVAIIGGGIFGCSASLELATNFDITVFEIGDNILKGASTVNHLRHHYGFHYPRSKDTVKEISAARNNFEGEYGDCISEVFEAYYAVSKTNSKTSPVDFLQFCDDMKLPYELKWPEKKYMDRSKIAICIKTPERVYDPDILKSIILRKIMEKGVKLRLNHQVIGGNISGKTKILQIKSMDKFTNEEFDYLIDVTYSNFNSFNKWFGLPRKTLQYELVELLELDVFKKNKFGLTIVDGKFSSILPRGEKGTFTLGHVQASIIEKIISNDIDPIVMFSDNIKTNKQEILRRGVEDFPFLKKASIIRSMFVTRVVKSDVDDTDDRPSEITDYGNGMYSIFGGKVITCVNISKKINGLIMENEKKS